MKVADAMCHDVQTVKADTPVREVARIMAKEDLGYLPVEDGNRIVGMITDRDITIRCVAEGRNGDARARDAMTNDVRYCFDDEDLNHVIENMGENQVRRMPVMNRNKRLVGIISLADAAKRASVGRTGAAMRHITQPGGAHAGDPQSRFS